MPARRRAFESVDAAYQRHRSVVTGAADGALVRLNTFCPNKLPPTLAFILDTKTATYLATVGAAAEAAALENDRAIMISH
jgi:hypothetical protein